MSGNRAIPKAADETHSPGGSISVKDRLHMAVAMVHRPRRAAHLAPRRSGRTTLFLNLLIFEP